MRPVPRLGVDFGRDREGYGSSARTRHAASSKDEPSQPQLQHTMTEHFAEVNVGA